MKLSSLDIQVFEMFPMTPIDRRSLNSSWNSGIYELDKTNTVYLRRFSKATDGLGIFDFDIFNIWSSMLLYKGWIDIVTFLDVGINTA